MLAATDHSQPAEDEFGAFLLSADAAGRLDLLRRQASRCRTAEHLDLHRACSLLTLNRDRAPLVFARALIRTLGQALGTRPVFHAPGASQISFDENWLLRLIDRLEQGDLDSFSFLIASRLPKEHRRSVAFLVHGIIADPKAARKPVAH